MEKSSCKIPVYYKAGEETTIACPVTESWGEQIFQVRSSSPTEVHKVTGLPEILAGTTTCLRIVVSPHTQTAFLTLVGMVDQSGIRFFSDLPWKSAYVADGVKSHFSVTTQDLLVFSSSTSNRTRTKPVSVSRPGRRDVPLDLNWYRTTAVNLT